MITGRYRVGSKLYYDLRNTLTQPEDLLCIVSFEARKNYLKINNINEVEPTVASPVEQAIPNLPTMYKTSEIKNRINAKFFTEEKLDAITITCEEIEARVEQTNTTINQFRDEKSTLESIFSRINDAVECKDISATEEALKQYADFLAKEKAEFDKVA